MAVVDVPARPVREFERVICYRAVAVAGDGTVDNPFREVEQWYREDGTVLMVKDPCARAPGDGSLDCG